MNVTMNRASGQTHQGVVDAAASGAGMAAWASPWPADVAIPGRCTVVDLVYNPRETRLLAQAKASGARAVGGLGMLVHQGALAFTLWTGHKAPLDSMLAAAELALARLSHDKGGC